MATGTFTTVTLDTAAYEALYAKRADFVITFAAWEGIEAAERGIKLRTFKFGDYGFPDFYQVILACDSRWLAANPDLARPSSQPRSAASRSRPTTRTRRPRSWSRRTRASSTATRRFPRRARSSWPRAVSCATRAGAVGRQTLEEWKGYSGFLYDQGLLVGPDGKPLTAPPDYGALFTNDFMP